MLSDEDLLAQYPKSGQVIIAEYSPLYYGLLEVWQLNGTNEVVPGKSLKFGSLKGQRILQQKIKRKLPRTILRGDEMFYTSKQGSDPSEVEIEKILMRPEDLLRYIVTRIHTTLHHLSQDSMERSQAYRQV